MRLTNKFTNLVLWCFLPLILSGQEPAVTPLSPEIRFQFPWTPFHEPLAADADQGPDIINLEETWRFWADLDEVQALEIISGKAAGLKESSVEVPASSIGWGFDAEHSGLFLRSFQVPHSWSNQNLKLKCEGIFERARIYINSQLVADHVGWTPFERDITEWVRCGENNSIAVFITMEGYAPEQRLRIRKGGYPDLGGILRPIMIHPVPPVHVMDLYIIPQLNLEQGQWNLEAQVTLVNPTDQPATVTLKGSLESDSGTLSTLRWIEGIIIIPAEKQITKVYSGPVGEVLPWNAESPHLYQLVLTIDDGHSASTVAERFGFRTVAIEGEKLLVNGRPITVRGIAYKGGHADYGNASPYAVLEEEVELMKQANVNCVRLGWAFKAPALHRVCDEKGLYVISSVGPDQFQFEEPLAIQQYVEAFMCLKNSPSILVWELQNENPRTLTPAYLKIMDLGRRIDPHRKFCHPGATYKELDLICTHYLPQLFGNDRRDGRPFLPTEYCHIPSYELDKLQYDPGIHDLWGYSIKRGWDIIKINPWVIGCITFAWRDPYLRDRSGKIVPALHHEARWGVVDESFRIKPEYHHLHQVYAPVRVSTKPIHADSKKQATITIENQCDFTNLNELNAQWEILGPDGVEQSGAWTPNIAPRTTKEVRVPALPKRKGDYILQLSFHDDSQRLVQQMQIPFIWKDYPKPKAPPKRRGEMKVVDQGETIKVEWSNGAYIFDRTSGMLHQVEVGNEKMVLTGPSLNQRIALPRPGRWFDWKSGVSMATQNWTRRVFDLGLDSFEVEQAGDKSEVLVTTVHQYQNGDMITRWSIKPDGVIEITATLPPKGYGVSWRFPATCRIIPEKLRAANMNRRFPERLAWRKYGLWSWYPETHLGRNVGTSSFLNPHDPQNHAMKINAAFVSVGPNDGSINLVIRDPEAKIHVKSHFWYNEFEIFVQGQLEDDYDYFDRTNPLKALPHALSEKQRTYTYLMQFVDKKGLENIERTMLNPYNALIDRVKFWDSFVDDLDVEDTQRDTVTGLPPNYPE
ncbi:MAG: glycoside hydrolase family 2 TIM barrel-domain containing protein [Candidatus Neomarinimicrobiota bacterium]